MTRGIWTVMISLALMGLEFMVALMGVLSIIRYVVQNTSAVDILVD